jgi:hypothetical protein
MIDFFGDLAGQVFGNAPEVWPLLPPRFALWPDLPRADPGERGTFPPPLIDPSQPAVTTPLPTFQQMAGLRTAPGSPIEPIQLLPVQEAGQPDSPAQNAIPGETIEPVHQGMTASEHGVSQSTSPPGLPTVKPDGDHVPSTLASPEPAFVLQREPEKAASSEHSTASSSHPSPSSSRSELNHTDQAGQFEPPALRSSSPIISTPPGEDYSKTVEPSIGPVAEHLEITQPKPVTVYPPPETQDRSEPGAAPPIPSTKQLEPIKLELDTAVRQTKSVEPIKPQPVPDEHQAGAREEHAEPPIPPTRQLEPVKPGLDTAIRPTRSVEPIKTQPVPDEHRVADIEEDAEPITSHPVPAGPVALIAERQVDHAVYALNDLNLPSPLTVPSAVPVDTRPQQTPPGDHPDVSTASQPILPTLIKAQEPVSKRSPVSQPGPLEPDLPLDRVLPDRPEPAIVPLPEPATRYRPAAAAEKAVQPLQPPLAKPARGEPEPIPTVRVTIGRVIVRTVPAEGPAPEQEARLPDPPLSLEKYLQGRTGGKP